MRNYSVVTALVFLMATGLARAGNVRACGADTLRVEIERELDFSPGGILSLKNLHGQIEVRGWEEDRVEIWVIKSLAKGVASGQAEELLGSVNVEIDGTESMIELKTGFAGKFRGRPEGSRGLKSIQKMTEAPGVWVKKLLETGPSVDVSWWIRVPRETNLEIACLTGYVQVEDICGKVKVDILDGSLLLQRIEGETEVALVNGPVYLEEVGGSLVVNSFNGSVKARLKRPADSVELNIVRGNLSLSLPAGAAVDLRASTLLGEIEIDPRLEVIGNRRDREVAGELNGGGPQVMVDCLMGEVSIQAL